MPVEEQAKKLEKIVFISKSSAPSPTRWSASRAGGMAGDGKDRPRVAIRSWRCRAAELAKADLVTAWSASSPELQGLMGGYCRAGRAARSGRSAIRDHCAMGRAMPTAPVTVAVRRWRISWIMIVSFFAIGEQPTDLAILALRRSIGVISQVLRSCIWP